MQARYRRDYDGEFVLLETRIANGRTVQQREWISNPVENSHISGRASVIGSRNFEDQFKHQRLQRHRGGLLGSKRLQTYGSGDLWTDMRFDFFVSTNEDLVQTLADLGYDKNSTVYTSARLCLAHPGRFYPVPFQPVMDVLGLALYLAAFDGHREIFMIGYDRETPAGKSSWQSDVARVIATYSTTQFYAIGSQANMPESWRTRNNFHVMALREFVSYCDV